MDDLLRLLRNNARLTAQELASELNMDAAEVSDRIAQLERDGTILGYNAIIDPQKAGGSSVTAVVEVKITPERGGGFDRLASRIAKFDEVQSCYLMSGGYDLLLVVEAPDLQQVAAFIAHRLSTIKGILATATHFRLKSYKENGAFHQREVRAQRLPVAP
jgi:DNA-binding Lrp family transcriptional regulator